jgi:methylated-DNA-[protein]-cysteine S-methyltransferase
MSAKLAPLPQALCYWDAVPSPLGDLGVAVDADNRLVEIRFNGVPREATLRKRCAAVRAIGQPGAALAVGQANGANPIPIVIPCHRVIASDGSLGGYTSGLAVKHKLLALEGVVIDL